MTTDVGSRELSKLELWEAGQRVLGYGDWTEAHPEPYKKWAGLEAHKLFLLMRRRGATQADFLLCVDYCHRHHIRIENATWVFKHYKDAKAEQRERTPNMLDQQIESAIAHERSFADAMSASWISKLTRAQGPYREEVLTEWEQFRRTDARSL